MSSLSSYGRGDEKTFRPISLDDPQLPDTDYGKSKLEAENYLRHQSYFPYVIRVRQGCMDRVRKITSWRLKV